MNVCFSMNVRLIDDFAYSAVPVSIYILSLPLPYLPDGAGLSTFFIFGSAILVGGLILYNIPHHEKQE